MKQLSFIQPAKKEHGGILSFKKRRSRRPLSIKHPLHITMRSDFAKGTRSLLKHRRIVGRVVTNASTLFHVKVYRQAICANHLHFLVKGPNREALQNFFRVVCGHIAQEILRQYPITDQERNKRGGAPTKNKDCKKNQRKFWALLLYSRILTWGREFKIVARYIVQNTLEALNIIAYQPRPSRFKTTINSS